MYILHVIILKTISYNKYLTKVRNITKYLVKLNFGYNYNNNNDSYFHRILVNNLHMEIYHKQFMYLS